MPSYRLICGDALDRLRQLPDASVHCCVTSPPYWGLRDYGVDGQIGLEETPQAYVDRIVSVFREVRRVLRDDGTCWVNLGDSYASTKPKYGYSDTGNDLGWTNAQSCAAPPGLKPKDLVGIPWRVAFALQADGWWLRSDIIWSKPNPMPESVTDRPTKAHEYVFLLSKSEQYYYDAQAIEEPIVSDPGSGNGFKRDARLSYSDDNGPRGSDRPWLPNGKHSKTAPNDPGRRITENVARARANGGSHDSPFGGTRNKRSVWTINTEPYPEAHFATFPQALVEPCIKAGCPAGGVVLDLFAGSGTVGLVANRLSCDAVLIELNPKYCEMIERRLSQQNFDLLAAGSIAL